MIGNETLKQWLEEYKKLDEELTRKGMLSFAQFCQLKVSERCL